MKIRHAALCESTQAKGQRRVLRTIAVFEFGKAAAVLALAIGVFHLLDPHIAHQFAAWIGPMAEAHHSLTTAIDWLLGLDSIHIEVFGALAVAYAVLFALEGIGLWRLKRWGEYLTIIITGLLIPVEVWELLTRATFPKLLLLVVNVAIVAVLVYLLRRESRGIA